MKRRRRAHRAAGRRSLAITIPSAALASGAGGSTPSVAPGAPGAESYFDLARKDCVGTARNTTSKVWFTVADGVLSDTYWPTIDATNVHTLQYLVSDGHSFTDLQTRDMTYRLIPDPTGMSCTVVASDAAHGYTITTTYIADPGSDSVLMRVHFSGPAATSCTCAWTRWPAAPAAAARRTPAATAPRSRRGRTARFRSRSTPTPRPTPSTAPTPSRRSRRWSRSTGFSTASVGYAGSASDGLTMLDSSPPADPLQLRARRPRRR